MQDLTIALIQTTPHWHDPSQNRVLFSSLLKEINNVDLVVLPEMFTTGFTMHAPDYAEDLGGPTTRWMSEMASSIGTTIMGSFILRRDGRYFNHMHWAYPDGRTGHYDKNHLFRMAGEDKIYSAGKTIEILSVKGWNIFPLICYDLRFPVWSRNKGSNEGLMYDILIYSANWPASRILAWDTLLKARAIENLAYCIGVNRIGKDGDGLEYNGHSSVYGPQGECLLDMQDSNKSSTLILHKEDLLELRKKFPAYLDSNLFTLTE